MMHIRVTLIAAALALAAPTATFAGPTEVAEIKDGCVKSTNWSEAACQCLADKAGELEDVEQAFLAASLNEDADAVAAVRPKMTVPQLTQAAMLIPNNAVACQGE